MNAFVLSAKTYHKWSAKYWPEDTPLSMAGSKVHLDHAVSRRALEVDECGDTWLYAIFDNISDDAILMVKMVCDKSPDYDFNYEIITRDEESALLVWATPKA